MATERFQRAFLRSPSTYLLAAVLGLAALGLTQCRMARESVTGVDVESGDVYKSGFDRCVRACIDRYFDCRRAEDQRHRAEFRKCDHVSGWWRRYECRRAEARRHDAAKERCRLDFQRCKRDCRYREGGGVGGR